MIEQYSPIKEWTILHATTGYTPNSYAEWKKPDEKTIQLVLCICGFHIVSPTNWGPKIFREKQNPESSKKQNSNLPVPGSTVGHFNEVMRGHTRLWLTTNVGAVQKRCHFIWGTWASSDFSIHRGSRTNPPEIPRDNAHTSAVTEGRTWLPGGVTVLIVVMITWADISPKPSTLYPLIMCCLLFVDYTSKRYRSKNI